MSRKMLRKDGWNCYDVVTVGIVFPKLKSGSTLGLFESDLKTFLSLKSHSLRVLSTVSPYVPIIIPSGVGKKGKKGKKGKGGMSSIYPFKCDET